ncbi:hypothetical protein M513_10221 [Trichuris suis]|uniref:Uncharacterized protein n=1 Tax=Trichuris suis TaxID=68888 RepID=A0A085LV62_9BILA|nr:hypothetical protein M513_10221 [Trichuris suis]
MTDKSTALVATVANEARTGFSLFNRSSTQRGTGELANPTGLYLLDVFRERLGVFSVDHKRFNPESDFGGLPSDPLVKNASDFLSEFNQGNYEIGAAFSCDGTRALIITQDGLPVTVSTSLAVVAENLQWFPFFKKSKDVKGFGRSLCTSRAVDRVAAALGIPCYEVSHNQIYFNRLMDEGKITLFGDELNGVSFCHGVRILFTNGSRLIFQVANYGNDQTTISIWVDSYGMDFAPGSPEEEIASPLLEIALQIAEIKKYTGQELAYYVI